MNQAWDRCCVSSGLVSVEHNSQDDDDDGDYYYEENSLSFVCKLEDNRGKLI